MTKRLINTAIWLTTTTLLSSAANAAEIGSFSDWQNAVAAGGEYVLNNNIDADTDLGSLSQELTIDGKGFAVNGNGNKGITVNTGAVLTLKNIGSDNASWNTTAHNIVNSGTLTMENVVFKNNETQSTNRLIGGLLLNKGQVNRLNNLIVESNRVINPGNEIWGGLISNGGSLDNASLNGNIDNIENSIFKDNYIYSTNYAPHGGIILNTYSTIGTIKNVIFENNIMESSENSLGGAHGVAIDNNEGSTINLITGSTFKNNKVIRTGTNDVSSSLNYHGSAAAVDNYHIIGSIENSIFESNSTSCQNCLTTGGAIMNVYSNNTTMKGYIGSIENTTFKGNNVNSLKLYARGGAISTGGTIDSIINTTFEGNFATAVTYARGGAIYNTGTIGNISGDFLNNYVKTSSTSDFTLGGGIYTTKNLTFTAAGKERFFSGNYTEDNRGKIYNGIYVITSSSSSPVLTFDTTGGGAWIINDNIDGGTTANGKGYQYNLALKGDGELNEDGLTDPYVAVNNDIVNAGEVSVEGTTLRFGAYQHEDKNALNWNGKGAFKPGKGTEAVTSLSLNNAAFDLYNKYQDTVELAGYKANNSFLHLDVDVENLTADMLNVNGNVEGTTKLVLYPTSGKDIRGESILFAQSENDTTGNANSFKVWRVYKSPYMFDVKYSQTGENANKWELEMNDTANDYAGVDPDERPDPEVPDPEIPEVPTVDNRKVTPEVIAYGALPAAAIEQTRSMVDNVAGQTGRTDAEHNLWINPTYYTSNIDAPFDIDADVWGVEAGGDLQHNLHNKIGLFVSYRKGNYDMNGDGKHYYSTVGSEVDIDSYLAGLYYRYDRNNWYAFATLYGGIQQADIKTDDGVKSDTDGIEFGGSVEAGYDYALTDTVSLTPSLGVFYTQVNYDDATDNVGKKAKYGDLQQIELEAGVKLTKAFRLEEGYANVYVKPSVVQTIVDGDEVNITGLGKVNTLDDETLGRIELGGRYGFTDRLSAYGWANYTFGSDYDATTVGLGLNYAF